MLTSDQVTGVILAGGRSQRLGGLDKGLVEYQGRPLIEYAIAALRPQVSTIMISANRHLDRYARYGYPVLPDPWPDFRGPLAGIAAALKQAPTEYIITMPCDNPRLPANFVQLMLSTLQHSQAEACALEHQRQLEPAYVLLPTRLYQNLMDYLDSGQRAVHGWLSQLHLARARYDEDSDIKFMNINTREDLGLAT